MFGAHGHEGAGHGIARPAQRARATLDRLLEAVRGGQSGVLVVGGEPGVGKTALLEYAIESASGFRVARAVGVEWEMELAVRGAFSSCARRCWIAWSGCQLRSARRSAWRSA